MEKTDLAYRCPLKEIAHLVGQPKVAERFYTTWRTDRNGNPEIDAPNLRRFLSEEVKKRKIIVGVVDETDKKLFERICQEAYNAILQAGKQKQAEEKEYAEHWEGTPSMINRFFAGLARLVFS
jgi:hypothetical protein